MKKWAHLLKQLLQCSDTKLIVLANVLGYDTSYISKWCNGSKIPSAKNIHDIHKKMSSIFAKEIIENKHGTQFFLEFDLDLPKENEFMNSVEFIENKIYNLLNQTYYQENPTSKPIQEEEIKFVVGKDEISFFLEEKLKTIFLKTNIPKIEIFLTVDFSNANIYSILSLLSNLKKEDTNIELSLGLNLKNLDNDSEKVLNKLFYILNCYINLNIELYHNSRFKNMNTILIKDHFAFQFSLDVQGDIQALTWVNNKLLLSKLSHFVLNGFRKEDKILGLANTRKLQKEGYRTNFYTSDFYNFFLVHGFEFLLPSAIIDNIADYAKNNKFSEQDLISILRVKIAWEEIFEKSSINFFILKSSILRYLEKGELTYMNINYKTSVEERKKHCEYAIELLEKNTNIHFYVIEDEFVDKTNILFNIGVFGNCKKMFFKNYYNLSQKKEPYFSLINNSKILEKINQFFDNIRESEYCIEYTADELKALWDKYGRMLFRLTEL
ncbi:hypothetical protein OCK72_06105 [Fusobacterium simiae]|uniref:HTH cro/C1-type domain-containing protein n=2 Tax=Fusobacterium simiae TaxID=855 RepID=A0ABT4DI07_FUSSI|nr:hypothetical protein [Fusobacterium simiae]MCY7008231.1 hypothetical protein [Fusobacterium simiae]